jgi:hypothetical protein
LGVELGFSAKYKKEHIPKVKWSRVFKRTFELKTTKAAGGQRKLHNKVI